MDMLPDKNISNVNRLHPFLTMYQAGLGIVRRLIGFFTITEEDQLAAGIYLGSKERVQ